jgi:hypothetical protein
MVKLRRGMEADVPLFWSVFMEKAQRHKELNDEDRSRERDAVSG